MGKKDKKKGKGAEKTALKTEKKALNRIKKNLAAKGEDDIEKLITEYQQQTKRKNVAEELCLPPSPRSSFSLCAHPDKEELVLFGGEFFNGIRTVMYNELYFYNIKKNQWSILHCPESPPPRCSHQAIVVSQRGGQMWVFGGEFASPSRSNFYHYKDLWVYHFAEKRWEEIKVPGGPTSRSGHRMVVSRKQIVVFGGFHETIRDYKYFNDLYTFNLETYVWSKIEPAGKTPSPRSGCQMAPLMDGRIMIYGGYCREKIKKDVDKGINYTDMYYLQLDERTKIPKWKWVQSKPIGIPPSPRSGLSIALGVNNYAYAFGGVHDEEDEDELLCGVFHNDFYVIELDKGKWQLITMQGKSLKSAKKRRRRAKDSVEIGETGYDEFDEDEVAEELEKTAINEQTAVKTYDDSIFTVKVGPNSDPSSSAVGACFSDTATLQAFIPKGRMNAGMVVKNGILYLYGGLYEEDDRQLTLSDFYSLDIHKLDEWKVIIPFSTTNLEWIESEESESSDSDSDNVMEADDSDEDEEMEMDTL